MSLETQEHSEARVLASPRDRAFAWMIEWVLALLFIFGSSVLIMLLDLWWIEARGIDM